MMFRGKLRKDLFLPKNNTSFLSITLQIEELCPVKQIVHIQWELPVTCFIVCLFDSSVLRVWDPCKGSLLSFPVFRCLLDLSPCCKDMDIKVGSEVLTIPHTLFCLKTA